MISFYYRILLKLAVLLPKGDNILTIIRANDKMLDFLFIYKGVSINKKAIIVFGVYVKGRIILHKLSKADIGVNIFYYVTIYLM